MINASPAPLPVTISGQIPPATRSDVIRALGDPPGFAKAIGVAESHARTMKARDSIPPEYWQALVAAAAAQGIEGVTLDLRLSDGAQAAAPVQDYVARLRSAIDAASQEIVA